MIWDVTIHVGPYRRYLEVPDDLATVAKMKDSLFRRQWRSMFYEAAPGLVAWLEGVAAEKGGVIRVKEVPAPDFGTRTWAIRNEIV